MRRDHQHIALDEIASMLKVTKASAQKIVSEREGFPIPATRLRIRKLWHHREVEKWMKAHPNWSGQRVGLTAEERVPPSAGGHLGVQWLLCSCGDRAVAKTLWELSTPEDQVVIRVKCLSCGEIWDFQLDEDWNGYRDAR
jgi:hypothetical protein